jgi:hypothetical protein
MEGAGITNLLLGIILALLSAVAWFVVAKFSIIEKILSAVKHNITSIIYSLISKDILDKESQGLMKSMSPTVLTEKGLELMDKSGFVKIVDEQRKDIFSSIEQSKPQTKYDVERTALQTVFTLFERDYFKTVKDYLFNNPNVDNNSWLKAASIYVRDKYLEANPHIK